MRQFTIVLMLLAAFCTGCGYGEVSPKTYKIATSLYNISNRKLSGKLEAIAKQIELAKEQDEISSKEARWLKSIVRKAEQKEWKQAMQDARKMMEDQIAK